MQTLDRQTHAERRRVPCADCRPRALVAQAHAKLGKYLQGQDCRECLQWLLWRRRSLRGGQALRSCTMHGCKVLLRWFESAATGVQSS
jgi:hypothetical protein